MVVVGGRWLISMVVVNGSGRERPGWAIQRKCSEKGNLEESRKIDRNGTGRGATGILYCVKAISYL